MIWPPTGQPSPDFPATQGFYMTRKFAIAAILLAASSGAAHAADLGSIEQARTAIGRLLWSGPYVGGQIGGAIETTDLGDTGLAFGSKGVYGGLTAGYDISLGGSFIGGVYGSINANDIGASFGGMTIDQRWTGKAGVRVGKASDSTLFYAPVAYTADWQHFSGVNASDYAPGVYTGLGVEQQFAGGWSMGLEAGGKWSGQTIGAIDTTRQSLSAELTFRKHF
jgi:hypothetical protein